MYTTSIYMTNENVYPPCIIYAYVCHTDCDSYSIMPASIACACLLQISVSILVRHGYHRRTCTTRVMTFRRHKSKVLENNTRTTRSIYIIMNNAILLRTSCHESSTHGAFYGTCRLMARLCYNVARGRTNYSIIFWPYHQYIYQFTLHCRPKIHTELFNERCRVKARSHRHRETRNEKRETA